MDKWYYSKHGAQTGPVTAQGLKELAESGELTPQDMVWKEGLPDWVEAAKVTGLFATQPAAAQAAAAPEWPAPAPQPAISMADHALPAPAAPAYAPAPRAVGYYNAAVTVTLPVRATHTLRNIPQPTGATDHWPLTDKDLADLRRTGSLRRWTFLLSFWFLLTAIVLIILTVVMAVVVLSAGAFGGSLNVLIPTLIIVLVYGGFAVLVFFCWKATYNLRAWAPITMGVLSCLGGVVVILGGFVVPSLYDVPGSLAIAYAVHAMLFGILAFICFKATATIRQFRAQPAWCQEALIGSKY